MKRLFCTMMNRMYCENYKLLIMINDFIRIHIPLTKNVENVLGLLQKYPVYKDLEPFREYEFDILEDLCKTLIDCIEVMNSFMFSKENQLKQYMSKQEIGFNVNNFVSSFRRDIMFVRDQSMLFISYIAFFHRLHFKFLKHIKAKLALLDSQLDHDIRIEDHPEQRKKKANVVMSELKQHGGVEDEDVLNEVFTTMSDVDDDDDEEEEQEEQEVCGQQEDQLFFSWDGVDAQSWQNDPSYKNPMKSETSSVLDV
jgi:hypothetical protein